MIYGSMNSRETIKHGGIYIFHIQVHLTVMTKIAVIEQTPHMFLCRKQRLNYMEECHYSDHFEGLKLLVSSILDQSPNH